MPTVARQTHEENFQIFLVFNPKTKETQNSWSVLRAIIEKGEGTNTGLIFIEIVYC